VGGHCIGVDPYYLTYKARETGYNPEMILAGRRINDGMAGYVAREAVKLLIRSDRRIRGARVGVLGLTFKENVPDLRNSKTAELVRELKDFGVVPLVHDPLADPREAKEEYGIELRDFEDLRNLDALSLAVGHAAYADLTPEGMREMFAEPENVVVLDVPGLRNKDEMLARGYAYWRL
jgi:UDP-N-acetyl-D-galactosamine dehydrogenase